MASLQGFRCELPTQRNRELSLPNWETWRDNREFCDPELESSPDEIFGTEDVWVMSAITPKAGIDRRLSHVRFVPGADILANLTDQMRSDVLCNSALGIECISEHTCPIKIKIGPWRDASAICIGRLEIAAAITN